MKRNFNRLVWLALLAVLVLPGVAKADKGLIMGMGVGPGIPFQTNDIAGEHVSVGATTYFDVGYGLSKYVELGGYLGVDAGPENFYYDYCDYGCDYYNNGYYYSNYSTWSQFYMGVYGRLTYPATESLEPFVNVGLGSYWFGVDTDRESITSDPTLGFRFGAGLNWFFGPGKRFFIGPDVEYHYVPYDTTFYYSGYGHHRYHAEGDMDMLEVMVKFGYQWKK
jgi:hypothetical protein